MKILVEHEVTSCTLCPYIHSTPEGPTCDSPGAPDYLDVLYVYPEGRRKIHPKCPQRGARIKLK